jgi:HAD superfamily hydrolase (TIGR01509 family)
MPVEAVIFDMDGVLIDSEKLWDDAREALVKEQGGRWGANAQRAMMGMASTEWSVYVRDELAVPMTAQAINDDIVGRLLASYHEELPLLPGAVDVVREIGARWPLGLASSSNREIIDLVLERAGISDCFAVTVSSEEVGRGKPAPDVFLEAARRLDVDAGRSVVIEDSGNGILAAKNAGMMVIAAPNQDFPPAPEALAQADVVVEAVDRITPQTIELAGEL